MSALPQSATPTGSAGKLASPRKFNQPNSLKRRRPQLWFLLPALLLYGGFLLLPMAGSVPLSLFNWSGAGPITDFIGLDNFARALRDDTFRRAALNNMWLFAALFLFTNTIALGLAVLLDRKLAFRDIYRAIIFLPYILSTVAIGFIWQMMLSPNIGLVNPGLEAVGLGFLQREWLADPGTAMWVLIAAFAWQWNALATVTFLAGLQNVPNELREAAVIDGANSWQVFRNVTVQALAPAFTTVNVLLVIVAFRAFELAYIITGPVGAPDGATLLMGVEIYRNAFATGSMAGATEGSMSYAMAQGLLLSVTLGVLAYGVLSFFSRRERYAD